jgi:N-acetylmuramic acid 6-phosphate etherase
MVRLGKTYSNLMVDVAPNNAKLRGRIRSILEAATGASEEESDEALRAAGSTKTALVSLATGADAAASAAALDRSHGRVRAAIRSLDDAKRRTDHEVGQGGDRM